MEYKISVPASEEELKKLCAGDSVLLSGTVYTARDAAHKRICEGELPHVKEKFYKGSSKNRGTGIGLSVCDEIVTRHGGRLDIDNAPGGGCVVSVSLPMNT